MSLREAALAAHTDLRYRNEMLLVATRRRRMNEALDRLDRLIAAAGDPDAAIGPGCWDLVGLAPDGREMDVPIVEAESGGETFRFAWYADRPWLIRPCPLCSERLVGWGLGCGDLFLETLGQALDSKPPMCRVCARNLDTDDRLNDQEAP